MNMDNSTFRFSDISLTCLVKHLLRNLWTIVAAAVIFALSASIYVECLHVPQ